MEKSSRVCLVNIQIKFTKVSSEIETKIQKRKTMINFEKTVPFFFFITKEANKKLLIFSYYVTKRSTIPP